MSKSNGDGMWWINHDWLAYLRKFRRYFVTPPKPADVLIPQGFADEVLMTLRKPLPKMYAGEPRIYPPLTLRQKMRMFWGDVRWRIGTFIAGDYIRVDDE